MPITSADDLGSRYPPPRPSRLERWRQKIARLGFDPNWRPPNGARSLLRPEYEHEFDLLKAWINSAKAAVRQIEDGDEPTPPTEFNIPQSHFRDEAVALMPWFTGGVYEKEPQPVAFVSPLAPRREQPGGHAVDVEWFLTHAPDDIDPGIAQELQDGIDLGADLDCSVSCDFHHPSFWNDPACREKSLEALKEEAAAGCFLDLGEVPMLPLRCNPRFTVDQGVKADGVTRKLRAIVNLSWRLSVEGASVNDLIDLLDSLHELKLTSGVRFGRDVGILAEIAQAVVLIKRDMANAFRQMPISPFDWWMQCAISGRGVEVDTRMIMGAKSSVHKFQRIHEFIVRTFRKYLAEFDDSHPPTSDPALCRHLADRSTALGPEQGKRTSSTHPYVDDACHATSNDIVTLSSSYGCLKVGSSVERGRVHEYIIDKTYEEAGIAMAGGEKAEFKYDVMESLGVEVDLRSKTLRYPPRKIPALKTAISEVLAVPKGGNIKRKKIEKLVGKEKWVAHVALEIDRFLASAYAAANAKPAVIGVGDRLRSDQQEILAALDNLPEVPLVPASAFPPPESEQSLVIFQDASTSTGYGGWFIWDSILFYVADAWPSAVRQAFLDGRWSISPAEAWAELLMLFLASQVASEATAVTDFTDNESTRSAARKGRSSSDAMRPIAEGIAAFSGQTGRVVRTLRVTTLENKLADALSRGEEEAAAKAALALGIPAQRLFAPTHLLDMLPTSPDPDAAV